MKNITQIAKLTTFCALASFCIIEYACSMDPDEQQKIEKQINQKLKEDKKKVEKAIKFPGTQAAEDRIKTASYYQGLLDTQEVKHKTEVQNLNNQLVANQTASAAREQQIREGMKDVAWGSGKVAVGTIIATWNKQIDIGDVPAGMTVLEGFNDIRKGSEKILNKNLSPWKS